MNCQEMFYSRLADVIEAEGATLMPENLDIAMSWRFLERFVTASLTSGDKIRTLAPWGHYAVLWPNEPHGIAFRFQLDKRMRGMAFRIALTKKQPA